MGSGAEGGETLGHEINILLMKKINNNTMHN
jgi:hypothetical protein